MIPLCRQTIKNGPDSCRIANKRTGSLKTALEYREEHGTWTSSHKPAHTSHRGRCRHTSLDASPGFALLSDNLEAAETRRSTCCRLCLLWAPSGFACFCLQSGGCVERRLFKQHSRRSVERRLCLQRSSSRGRRRATPLQAAQQRKASSDASVCSGAAAEAATPVQAAQQRKGVERRPCSEQQQQQQQQQRQASSDRLYKQKSRGRRRATPLQQSSSSS